MMNLSYLQRAKNCPSVAGKKLLELMHEKQTNLALSADVTSAQELLHLAANVGADICLLKTHIDIIHDFTPALTKELTAIAKEKNFMLFEDRKFADIGNTVKLQYEGGVYNISSWADFTNAHSLPGPGLIEGLKSANGLANRGLLLIAELSCRGHLLNESYMQATLKMAEQFPEFVAGFITQHALTKDGRWINFTPGVKLEQGGDGLGQQYDTPESAILERGTDVIIVGRGIIAAKSPIDEAKRYRISGWNAYQKRCIGQSA